jgi:hypothetical protein
MRTSRPTSSVKRITELPVPRGGNRNRARSFLPDGSYPPAYRVTSRVDSEFTVVAKVCTYPVYEPLHRPLSTWKSLPSRDSGRNTQYVLVLVRYASPTQDRRLLHAGYGKLSLVAVGQSFSWSTLGEPQSWQQKQRGDGRGRGLLQRIHRCQLAVSKFRRAVPRVDWPPRTTGRAVS